MQTREPTDQPAVDELLRQTRWLHHLARALGADDAAAHDLVQDTFAQALRDRPRERRDLRALLGTMLRRRTWRWLQRERARARVEARAAGTGLGPPTDEMVARAMVHRDVVDAVLALGEPYRTAILLRYLQELPIAEVAARSGVPLATARSRVQRGLAQLRERLDRRYGARDAWLLPLAGGGGRTLALTFLLCMNGKLLVAAIAAGLAVGVAWWSAWSTPLAPAPSPTPTAARPEVATAPPPIGGAAPMPQREEVAHAEPAAPPAAVRAFASGVVVDEETRAPLAGVEISWRGRYSFLTEAMPAVVTDHAGRFELPSRRALPHESCDLALRKAGYAWVDHQLAAPAAGTPTRYDAGVISLPPGTGVAGRVVDADGAPVAGAELLFYDTTYWVEHGRCVMLDWPLPIGRSADDGTFHPPARLIGVQDAVLIAASAHGLGWLAVPQLTRARSEADGLQVRLRPSYALTVQVVGPDAVPLAGAEVLAVPRFEPLGHERRGPLDASFAPELAPLFTARTAADGTARLPSLPRADGPSPYLLVARAPGHLDEDLAVDLAVAERRATLLLGVPRPIAVTGSVVAADGSPIAGAKLVFGRPADGGDADAVSDASGAFACTVALRASELGATVRADGWREVSLRQRVAPTADTAVLRFRLDPAASIRGSVVDDDGVGLAAVTVVAVGEHATATTDGRGHFELANVPAQRDVEVCAMVPEPAAAWLGDASGTARPGGDAVTLRLRRSGSCRLRVELVAADGAPLEARHHQLQYGNGDGDWFPSTATLGRVAAERLRPGHWTLWVDAAQGASVFAEFDVAVGEAEKVLSLRQAEAAVVTGEVVVDPPGLDLASPLRLFCGHRNRGRFVTLADQQLEDGELLLDPARAPTFRIEDVDPARPLQVFASGGDYLGRAELTVGGGGSATVRLRIARAARVRFVSAAPWPVDELRFALFRPGEIPARGDRVLGVTGRTELLELPYAAGTWRWRAEAPAIDAGPATVYEGEVELRPGACSELLLDAASAVGDRRRRAPR